MDAAAAARQAVPAPLPGRLVEHRHVEDLAAQGAAAAVAPGRRLRDEFGWIEHRCVAPAPRCPRSAFLGALELPIDCVIIATACRGDQEFLTLDAPHVPKRSRRGKQVEGLDRGELEKLVITLEEEMYTAAEELRFEYAAKLRDEIKGLRRELGAVAESAA